MKKTLTLKPSYATTNTVRFDEDGVVENTSDFLARHTVSGALGKPYVQYLDSDQLNAIGWEPTSVGPEYQTEPNRRGQSYTRRDVVGPTLSITIEVK